MIDLAAVTAILGAAIAERRFPGALAWFASGGEVVQRACVGTTMYDDPRSRPLQPDAIFDLASLTKLFTAFAALRLADAGALELDRPAQRLLPALRTSDVTPRHLLSHTSGLEARMAVWRDLPSAIIRAHLFALEPRHAPGSFHAYANLSSALLGELVAAAYGRSFGEALHDLVLNSLELHETRFNPPPTWRERIPPTEDEAWRGLVHGVVHDESAYALGGIAGHAGLFGSAADLWRFAQGWLNGGVWRGRQFLREATVAEALRDGTSHLPNPTGAPVASGLGWMLDRAPFMGAAPAGTAGHTGFTGPALIIAPAQGKALIVLSNRTYPQRTPPPYRHHPTTAALANLLWADR